MASLPDEDRLELQALILAFLQQSLNDFPIGMTLRDFERHFPEKSDESQDWYKRYNCRDTVQALRLVPQVAKLTTGYGNQLKIELNTASKLHDTHLTDMVKGQKAKPRKNKARGARPMPCSLNRRPQPGNFRRPIPGPYSRRPMPSAFNNSNTNWPTKEQQSNNNRQSTTQTNSSFNSTTQSSTSEAFRTRTTPPESAFDSWGKPEVIAKPKAAPEVAKPKSAPEVVGAKPAPGAFSAAKPQQALASAHASAHSHIKPSQFVSENNNIRREEAPIIPKKPAPKDSTEHKEWLRQKIVDLFTRLSSEIKLLFLPSIYQTEYEEPLDPTEYGYSRITALFEDPILSKDIVINYKQPYTTISSRLKLRPDGKENRINGSSPTSHNSTKTSNNHESLASLSQDNSIDSPFEAIDPFNLKIMQQSLQKSFVPIKEKKINIIPIDEEIKYKTFRMIMTSKIPLEIDKWQNNFEYQTKLSIRVSYYGFSNSEDFFKELVKDMPIKIERNHQGRLIATMTSQKDVTDWLNSKMAKNEYKSIYVLCDKYELIANPKDHFTFRRISPEMQTSGYIPVILCSAKNPSHIWLKLHTERLVEDQLFIESSMCAYQDYTVYNTTTKSTMLPGMPRFFVKVGLPCSVYDQHLNKWCRAIIVSIVESAQQNQDVDFMKVNLLLVDYGVERKNVPVKQLHCLLKDHMRVAVIPIQCHLEGVKPVVEEESEVQGEWSGRAKVILQEYVNPPSLLACRFISEREAKEKISVDAHLPLTSWGVELCDTRGDEDCFLHLSLIEAGLAVNI